MASVLPEVIYTYNDRVVVTDEADPLYGLEGEIVDWHYGMAGGIVYHVRLDAHHHFDLFVQSQLSPGVTDDVAA